MFWCNVEYHIIACVSAAETADPVVDAAATTAATATPVAPLKPATPVTTEEPKKDAPVVA